MRVAWLVLCASCVGSQSAVCDDGTVCPSASTCVLDRSGSSTCASEQQLFECAGRPDGTACAYGDPLILGTCFGEVCLPSDFTCGNSITDPTIEQCDDGNVLAHDGCSSTCGDEIREWRATPVELFGRDDVANNHVDGGAQMVYDSRRDRVVLVSGTRRRVWEWDGIAWAARTPVISPPPRTAFALAFDAVRGRVVMFGGRGNGTLLADLWEWDGTSWALITPPAPTPPPRSHAMMAYDPVRAVVVLVGGSRRSDLTPAASESARDDHWEWDGARWTAVELATRPAARKGAAMTYDPRRGVIVMFGGRDVIEEPLADTWELSAAGWTERAASGPPPRALASAAYDPIAGGIVVHGGNPSRDLRTGSYNDTWLWDGESWQLLDDSSDAGAGETMAPFPRGGQLMRVDRLGVTHAFDGVRWVPLVPNLATPLLLPDEAAGYASAVDVAGRRLASFGGPGTTSSAFSQKTHLWNGAQWSFATSAPPPGRINAAMAYDEARGQFVLFGGKVFDGPDDVTTDDTWTLDGANVWAEVTPAVSPPARSGHAMAYDPIRERVVMFGGDFDGAADDGATWEWDGTSWTSVPQASSPPIVGGAVAAWDPSRRAIVWFGGPDGETFTYDGTWHRLELITSPGPRQQAGLAWNPPHRRLVLFGGLIGVAGDDLWELGPDDDGWRFVPVAGPGGRAGHIVFPLFDGSGVGAFGGGAGDGVIALVSRSEALEETCARTDTDGDGLARCDDPDCWWICTPRCAPGTPCMPGPTCGDGTCDPHERCETCPEDCTACAPVCGDGAVDPGEDQATCPGDAAL